MTPAPVTPPPFAGFNGLDLLGYLLILAALAAVTFWNPGGKR